MDCVNHSGVNATAFCQNCGKPLCQACVRRREREDRSSASRAGWRGNGGQQPFVAPPVGGPNPVLAAVLGLIPGVGAMYNGQFIKGLIHVVIFAVLVSAAHVTGSSGSSSRAGSATRFSRPITRRRRGATASPCPIRWG